MKLLKEQQFAGIVIAVCMIGCLMLIFVSLAFSYDWEDGQFWKGEREAERIIEEIRSVCSVDAYCYRECFNSHEAGVLTANMCRRMCMVCN